MHSAEGLEEEGPPTPAGRGGAESHINSPSVRVLLEKQTLGSRRYSILTSCV